MSKYKTKNLNKNMPKQIKMLIDNNIKCFMIHVIIIITYLIHNINVFS